MAATSAWSVEKTVWAASGSELLCAVVATTAAMTKTPKNRKKTRLMNGR